MSFRLCSTDNASLAKTQIFLHVTMQAGLTNFTHVHVTMNIHMVKPTSHMCTPLDICSLLQKCLDLAQLQNSVARVFEYSDSCDKLSPWVNKDNTNPTHQTQSCSTYRLCCVRSFGNSQIAAPPQPSTHSLAQSCHLRRTVAARTPQCSHRTEASH